MKKILPLILVLLLFAGCSEDSNSDKLNGNVTVKDDVTTKEDVDLKDIYIKEIESFSFDWAQIQFPIELNEEELNLIKPVESNQRAVEIARAILEELHNKGDFTKYELISIVHSTQDNIWRFEYSLDQRDADSNNLIDSGCLNVVIDGNAGDLIKAWVEE